MKILNFKKQILVDSGEEERQEDELVYLPSKGVFGVMDGVSGLYTPDVGPPMFDGISGAQKAARIVSRELANSREEEQLSEILLRANRKILEFQQIKGYGLQDPVWLSAVDVAVAKIAGDEIDIIATSDSFAVWETNDGKIGATKNQGYIYDSKMQGKLKQLIEKYQGDKARAWHEVLPEMARWRREIINKNVEAGFSYLNGMPEVEECWQAVKLNLPEVKLLLLFTDGLVSLESTEDELIMGKSVINLYKQSGLRGLLDEARKIQESEATAIALEFDN